MAAPQGLPQLSQNHSIWTPELVEISLPLAGITRRVLARLIDQTILLGVYIGIFIFAAINVFGNTTVSLIVGLVLFILADFFYFWAFHTLMGGQTPGKSVLNIRVVTMRGGRINGVTALIRSFFNFIDNLLLYNGIASLMLVSTQQERRIADFASGTIVIIDN